MTWWLTYLAIGATATIITGLSVPWCRRVAWRFDFLDRPMREGHKGHQKSTPLLGGLAMLIGWLLTLGGGLAAALLGRPHLPPAIADVLPGLLAVWQLLAVLAFGATSLAIMGLVDDRKALGPGAKFFLQFLICSVVALYPELRVTMFITQPIVTWALTVGWFLFIINAFNFLDNMDGLASGLAMIAAFLFCIVAGIREQHFVAALAITTAGAALGFYCYNRAPASIFMGDSGSHFLGFVLAALGPLTSFYIEAQTPTIAPIFMPLLILALPIFDAFAVVYIRLKEGRPIYTGDHSHISHRFLRLGGERKTAVVLVHLLALAIGLGALSLLWMRPIGVVLVLAQTVVMLTLVSVLHGIDRPAASKPPPVVPPPPTAPPKEPPTDA